MDIYTGDEIAEIIIISISREVLVAFIEERLIPVDMRMRPVFVPKIIGALLVGVGSVINRFQLYRIIRESILSVREFGISDGRI